MIFQCLKHGDEARTLRATAIASGHYEIGLMAATRWRTIQACLSQCGTLGMYVAESKRLTHQGAKKIMMTAVDMASQAGIAISCAIVDAGGHMILLERMDGGRFHTVHSCTTKAVCAASNRRPTTAKGAAGQDLDVSHAIGLALAAGPERWTAMEGGVPVLVDGECIGGVGVSGGDWETDLRIAKAAIESIGLSWK
jgi:glc operon protein GlcG